ncbi:histidine phosphatase family protein [Sulfurimonas sp.]
MKLTIVRHGEVEEAYIGKYNGHNNISLSENGKVQAQELARKFKNESFDVVYCSDLQRAKETLSPFENIGQVIYTQKLREKSWGRHEGLSFDEIVELEEKQYENFQQWIDSLDGEKQEYFLQRVKVFFQESILPHKNKDILLITHAGVIRAFISLVENLSFEESFKYKLPYASYILYDGKKLRVKNL